MALKGDRNIVTTQIDFFADMVMERGGVVVYKTAGSGAALDQQAAEVEYAAASSGEIPVGILLNDMVDEDLTRTELNEHKDEMQKGSKVTICRAGWVTTNMIEAGVTPTANGQKAYLGVSGLLTTTAGVNPEVGEFQSTKDEDGYAKVYINLPK